MRPSRWLLLTQLSICVALATSSALYVHYLSPLDSGFCGPSSGCEAARQSGIGYFFGSRYLSLPLVSLLAFAALLGLSLRSSRAKVRQPAQRGLAAVLGDPGLTLFAASGVGAVAALGLIAWQGVVLGAFCWLCLVVDGAALGCALFSFLAARASRVSGEPARSPLHGWAWAAIAGLVVAGPLVWDAVKPAPGIPERIAALHEPGKINVVEFADFECPYCRRLHALLEPLTAEYGAEVRFRRVHRPLWTHPNAEHAARAALCADAQGRGEAMANRLFEMPLSPEAIRRAAESLRLDPLAFDRCLVSPETTARLERDAALLPDEELRGLPTLFVGGRSFVGVPSEAALRDAFERARRPPPPALPGPLYAALLAFGVGLVAFAGRRRGH